MEEQLRDYEKSITEQLVKVASNIELLEAWISNYEYHFWVLEASKNQLGKEKYDEEYDAIIKRFGASAKKHKKELETLRGLQSSLKNALGFVASHFYKGGK